MAYTDQEEKTAEVVLRQTGITLKCMTLSHTSFKPASVRHRRPCRWVCYTLYIRATRVIVANVSIQQNCVIHHILLIVNPAPSRSHLVQFRDYLGRGVANQPHGNSRKAFWVTVANIKKNPLINRFYHANSSHRVTCYMLDCT